jgi:hypothetical protein
MRWLEVGSRPLKGMRPVWPRLIYFAVKFQGMRSWMRLVFWSCMRSSTQVGSVRLNRLERGRAV